MSYLETLLRTAFEAEGTPDAAERAATAAKNIEKAGLIDRMALVRVQILADRETDHRVIMRRYHVSRGFVYNVWNSRRSAA